MRQLCFAFLQERGHIARDETKSGSISNWLRFEPVILHRIDPTKNMRRFYALDVERDLFGSIVLARRWGRIGAVGRIRFDAYKEEGRAQLALVALQRMKERKGYHLVT